MTRSDDRRSPQKGAMVAFCAMSSVYFFSHFQRTAIPGTIFDELQAEYSLAAADVAALGAVFTWIYGGMQIVVGVVVDAWGGRRSFLLGSLAMALGSLLFPLAASLPPLFVARALTGFGASFLYLAIVKEIGIRFGSGGFSAMIGALLAVGYCGGMTATLPFERAVAAVGWRPSLLLVAALTFLALAAFLLTAMSGPRFSGTARSPSFRQLGVVLANRRCLPSYASSTLAFPIYFVVLTMLGKKFLQDFGGLDSASAAATLLAMSATSALTVAAGGLLPRLAGDRRKPFLVGGGAMILVAVAILLGGSLTGAPAWLVVVGFVLLAAAIGLSGPSGAATMKDLNPPESLASGISVTNALAYLGCGTVAWACGLILDRFRPTGSEAALVYPPAAYAVLFSFLSALALLNFGLTLAIPETRAPARQVAPAT